VTLEQAFVFGVVVAALALFASDRLRLDVVALLALLALAVSGILTPSEALAGFSDPVVIMIAGLFVVGAGLFKTGVADMLGRWVGQVAGESAGRLTLVLILVTALLSAFLSSTGTVAVMLPVALALARRAQLSPSRLLIPLAFASLLGGMLTLIGTPPNLIVSTQLAAHGYAPFNFFSFTPVGLVMLAVGALFMTTLGSRLLVPRAPAKESREGPGWRELLAEYGLAGRLARARIEPGSPLAGRGVADTALRSRYRATILAIASPTTRGVVTRRAEASSVLREGDTLYLYAEPEALQTLADAEGLTLLEGDPSPPQPRLIEALVPPRSSFVGRTLRELKLRHRSGATVLAIKQAGEVLEPERPLRVGDALLLMGSSKALQSLAAQPQDLVLLGEPPAADARRWRQAPVAVVIMAALLAIMTFELLPHAVAVLAAAVAMVLSRCLSMDEAYKSINWESVVLIAAILPLATALDKTGGLALVTGGLLAVSGELSGLMVLAGFFVFTSLLSQLISNTATTVLIAPVAIQAAVSLGLSPHALLMTVAVAASTAFATPVASPVNALVLNPGAYRFGDFVKVGVPLQLLILVATLLVVPRLFPL
jgi:di/tricarboxylate transporter